MSAEKLTKKQINTLCSFIAENPLFRFDEMDEKDVVAFCKRLSKSIPVIQAYLLDARAEISEATQDEEVSNKNDLIVETDSDTD